ncbi:hypothetical protein AMTRI_Chr06g191240 [Amborella trichopoda]
MQEMLGSDENLEPTGELSVSFGYHCSLNQNTSDDDIDISTVPDSQNSTIGKRSSSFSCLSGAALSANATLANTNICNGLIAEEILPSFDSPKSFRRLPSSSSLSRLDPFFSSSQSSVSTLGGTISTESDMLESNRSISMKPMSAPTRLEASSFLNAMDVQMAGGAAGEDRVQAVCSEENGWLYCGVYDGFNGRDAADFLAGTLYDNIGFYLHLLEWRTKQQGGSTLAPLSSKLPLDSLPEDTSIPLKLNKLGASLTEPIFPISLYGEISSEAFRNGVIDCLRRAISQAESDFMYMVEQEMEDRPDLVSVGSCVLVVLLHGNDLYTLNIGDSRAVLAKSEDGSVTSVQLTDSHTVENDEERMKLLAEHPDDASTIVGGRVKGKLKVTRAFGVGYLKESKMNDALMGILRVRNLCSPPYISANPSIGIHRVTDGDLFVVIGSDGLFDFFSNDEVVELVHQFIEKNPFGDPAKYLLEQLVLRAAQNAGFSIEELMRIPAGRRRKYHDDVTVIVIMLGNKQRTSTASTSF